MRLITQPTRYQKVRKYINNKLIIIIEKALLSYISELKNVTWSQYIEKSTLKIPIQKAKDLGFNTEKIYNLGFGNVRKV